MKLRNKKTGEIFDALIREKGGGGSYSLIVCDIKAYEQNRSTPDITHSILGEYDTLAKFNEDWEDYKPTEPLIKDEKIRKAVRAWAEVDALVIVKVETDYRLESVYDDAVIRFDDPAFKDLPKGRNLAITELCGEEEE